MRILLDQGLPRSSAALLRELGFDAVHTGECGLATASDGAIIISGREEGRVIVTLDSDFHALLALSGATSPSIIRIRIEGLRAEAVSTLVASTLGCCWDDLGQGAVVSVDENRVRVRSLPIMPRR